MKYTIETFARDKGISKQSALNMLSKLRKRGLVWSSGGGKQKRIYNVTKLPQEPTNGFYDIANRFSPNKLVPKFRHIVKGRYTIEHAIIDGIQIGDARTLEATKHLFRHVQSWKRLFDLAKKKGLSENVLELYVNARASIKVKKIPMRYQ